MKTNLRDFFYYSKTQRSGFFVLICLLSIIFFLGNNWSNTSSNASTNFSEFEKDIIAFEKANKNIPDSYEEVSPIKKIPKSTQGFNFNPNRVSKDELIQLGLSSSVATTLIKYRNTGAKFYKKEDLKKVYGIKEADYRRLEQFINIPSTKQRSVKKKPKVEVKPKLQRLTPFDFNPNIVTKEKLLDLGLSSKVAQTVINFRNKGGQFWKKEDFKKIYGLTEKNYTILESFIKIPKTESKQVKKTNTLKEDSKKYIVTDLIKVDINNSTVEDWEKLKGIGEYTAKRIVDFRDKLGGFTAIEQVKETWNVPDSVIDEIASQLIESPFINKIFINTISVDELKLHPYIKIKEARVIVNFRTNHGNYTNVEDLKKVRALTPIFIERIAPYLSFE